MRSKTIRRLKLAGMLAMAPLLLVPASAQVSGSRLIDFPGYQKLTSEVAPYRAKRLIKLPDFQARVAKENVLLLDARSAQAFAQGHIEGAINLPLPDFTAGELARVIGPDVNREILIYCNNNFSNNARPVQTKMVTLALNIQTFINLYGYGFRNVYELADVVDMHDPAVKWVASAPLTVPIASAPQS